MQKFSISSIITSAWILTDTDENWNDGLGTEDGF